MPYAGPYEEITLKDEEQQHQAEEQDPLATDNQVEFYQKSMSQPVHINWNNLSVDNYITVLANLRMLNIGTLRCSNQDWITMWYILFPFSSDL